MWNDILIGTVVWQEIVNFGIPSEEYNFHCEDYKDQIMIGVELLNGKGKKRVL